MLAATLLKYLAVFVGALTKRQNEFQASPDAVIMRSKY